MITIKTVLRKKLLSNDLYPVCLRVTLNRKAKYFRTPFTANLQEWDQKTGRYKKNHQKYISSNRVLNKIEGRAMDIISELEIESAGFSLGEFERHFRFNRNPAASNFFNFWQEIISEMLETGRIGNANANHHTRNSLLKFNRNNSDLRFKEITSEFLNKYEIYLRTKGGTDGGIGVKMRAIRAIFNRAINRGICKEEDYPFKKYKISKLKGRSIKKALNIAEIREIENLDVEKHPRLRDSKNIFLFSFYTRGMNFADIMKLKWKEVTQERIHYTRSKTKGNFIIKILPPVQEILNYYSTKRYTTSYVFPILLHDKLTPAQINERKRKCLKNFNKDLKEIALLCHIKKPLTSYVARHSYANCLKQKGVATDIISESMGHQDIATTKAYLKELDSGVLDDANELLLN